LLIDCDIRNQAGRIAKLRGTSQHTWLPASVPRSHLGNPPR
jgi:hypothetical protein